MSITTSREDRDAAATKLAERTDQQLLEDMGYWAVTTGEHQYEYRDLSEKAAAVLELHNEAQAWCGLITEELMRRRGRRRSVSIEDPA